MDSPGVLLRRHGLHPKRSFGQNFLADADIQEQIARLIHPAPGEVVVELGAGLGHLTAELVNHGARVLAVERDRDLAPVLREELATQHPDLTVVEANAVTFDLAALSREAGSRVVVCGNLPYHLGSPILFHVLDNWRAVKRLVVLLQREVVERIVAAPDTENYGLLSVLLQHVADVRLGMRVGAGAFVPPPAVDSAVLVAEFLDEPRAPVASEAAFRKLVKAAFSQRRKTLSNALRSIAPKDVLASALRTAGIDPIRRGETLSVEEFAVLERVLAAMSPRENPPRDPSPPALRD
jgi:16S rRNA (adenine1518-N6/adenine1519-N6)-dimethyltransferase